MKSRIVPKLILPIVLALSSCAQDYTVAPPQVSVYVPQYADFTYKIDGKVQVKHSYLFGAGVRKCYYVGRSAKPYMEGGQLLYPYKSAEMDNFFEANGHIYQGGVNRDKNILGSSSTSRLGGDIDPNTGKQQIHVTKMWDFSSLCYSRIGSSEFGIYLQKRSALSIAQDIDQTRRLMGGAWKHVSRVDPEFTTQVGNNKWTVLKKWNRADYLSDAAEYWYLPLGDGSYYYKLIFTYKSAMRERGEEEYIKSRAMFDRILNSFEVRELTPEESAAIVNPEPIEPKKPTKEDHERFVEALRKM